MVNSDEGSSKNEDWCECCHQLCTDADRQRFYDRFQSFAKRNEVEWSNLDFEAKLKEPTPPGVFPFTRLPREIRDQIYELLIVPKGRSQGGKYATHDHTFPTQILYVGRKVRDEFLGRLMDRIFVMCQYSTYYKHIELQLPPTTLFHRVQKLWARLIVTDAHGTPISSWLQILLDASLFLAMFPALRGCSLLFKGVFSDDKSLEEAAVEGKDGDGIEGAWERSEVRNTNAVKRVSFELEGPGTWKNLQRRQRVDEFLWHRYNTEVEGSDWWNRKGSEVKVVG